MNIPPLVKKAIDNHVLHGHACGNFVTAVLENNLSQAIGYADENSLASIKDIVSYCYNQIPGPCWGSKKAVKEWREKGGDPNAHIGY